MATRVYVVADNHAPASELPRLIEATYEHTALRHASHGRYSAHVASKRELVDYMGQGVKVEHADPLRSETQVSLELVSAQVPELLGEPERA